VIFQWLARDNVKGNGNSKSYSLSRSSKLSICPPIWLIIRCICDTEKMNTSWYISTLSINTVHNANPVLNVCSIQLFLMLHKCLQRPSHKASNGPSTFIIMNWVSHSLPVFLQLLWKKTPSLLLSSTTTGLLMPTEGKPIYAKFSTPVTESAQ